VEKRTQAGMARGRSYLKAIAKRLRNGVEYSGVCPDCVCGQGEVILS